MGNGILCLSAFLLNWKNFPKYFSWTALVFDENSSWYSYVFTFQEETNISPETEGKSSNMEQIRPPCMQSIR